MNILEEKKELRALMLSARVQQKSEIKKNYDQWICEELKKTILLNNYKFIHCYLPMGKEIDITPLVSFLLANKYTLIVPKTLPKRKLQNLILNSLNEVEKGIYGTSHPANSIEYKGEYDFIIVPGLAFDKNNYRLGYGGGYYDNFLVQHPNTNKTGIFYPFQQVEKVPIENHDIQLSKIIVRPFE